MWSRTRDTQATRDRQARARRAAPTLGLILAPILPALAALCVGCGGGPGPAPGPSPATAPGPTPTPVTVIARDPVQDADGTSYRTLQIGDQVWMAENLRATRRADGGALAGVYAYGDVESNVTAYGRLYTWPAAMAPVITGWHLPTEAEWTVLINAVGVSTAGAVLRIGGTSGFDAVFGGSRNYDGSYASLGVFGQYWSSTPSSADHAATVHVFPTRPDVDRTGLGFTGAASVRLVRDR